MTAADLHPDLRQLIDARLEAVDRMLAQAQVSWSERRSIVGEVETQIFELLGRRSAMPAREDVLAVLASLDPPESYMPDDLREALASENSDIPWRHIPQRLMQGAARSLPIATGAAALVVVNGVVILLIAASEGVIPWIVTLAGLVWLNVAGVRRFRAWSAAHPGSLVDEFRHSLVSWLLSPNGARAT